MHQILVLVVSLVFGVWAAQNPCSSKYFPPGVTRALLYDPNICSSGHPCVLEWPSCKASNIQITLEGWITGDFQTVLSLADLPVGQSGIALNSTSKVSQLSLNYTVFPSTLTSLAIYGFSYVDMGSDPSTWSTLLSNFALVNCFVEDLSPVKFSSKLANITLINTTMNWWSMNIQSYNIIRDASQHFENATLNRSISCNGYTYVAKQFDSLNATFCINEHPLPSTTEAPVRSTSDDDGQMGKRVGIALGIIGGLALLVGCCLYLGRNSTSSTSSETPYTSDFDQRQMQNQYNMNMYAGAMSNYMQNGGPQPLPPRLL